MLQSFEDIKDPSKAAARIAALRQELARRQLDGMIVPRSDEYQGEYVPPSAERLFWLSGFSGSAGTVVVLADKAALFVDGRYTAQAQEQVDPAVFGIEVVPASRPSAWITAEAPPSARIGYDPRLFTKAEVEQLDAILKDAHHHLVATADNPLDAIWSDRPEPPIGAVRLQPLSFAGRSATDKVAELQRALAQAGDDALLVTAPDSIAWLLNVRGSDVPFTPLPLSTAIVPARGPLAWFIDQRKISDEVRAALGDIVVLHEPETLEAALAGLGSHAAKVRIDPQSASAYCFQCLEFAGAKLIKGDDPCRLAKACKNSVELDGARAAHRRDGAALARFLAWLDRTAPLGTLDEVTCAQRLEALRQDTGLLLDLSFNSISAAGAHAALPHYRPSFGSNAKLAPNSVYLIDSGGQYQDGTTDVTRTIAIGTPPADARRAATLVLKGMIAISTARFPKGTRGIDLDPLARRALWQAGFDFDHGTGHGVGSYLSVHEGPQGISRRAMAVLEPGMIVSNEPGYYREGAFGIRIENLLVVTPLEPIAGGDRPMHGFETLTLAPIDQGMIDVALLDASERAWLDAYHARVLTEIGPLLDADDATWLATACRPVAA